MSVTVTTFLFVAEQLLAGRRLAALRKLEQGRGVW